MTRFFPRRPVSVLGNGVLRTQRPYRLPVERGVQSPGVYPIWATSGPKWGWNRRLEESHNRAGRELPGPAGLIKWRWDGGPRGPAKGRAGDSHGRRPTAKGDPRGNCLSRKRTWPTGQRVAGGSWGRRPRGKGCGGDRPAPLPFGGEAPPRGKTQGQGRAWGSKPPCPFPPPINQPCPPGKGVQ